MARRKSIFIAMILLSTTALICSAQLPARPRRPVRGRRPPTGMPEDLERRMQARRAEAERNSRERQKIREQYIDEAYREALGADDNQWKIIKPRLERVKQLANTPSIGITVYGGGSGTSGSRGGGSSSGYRFSTPVGGQGGGSSGGGPYQGVAGPTKKTVGNISMGWMWRRPSLGKNPEQLTPADRTHEQLLDLLEDDKPDRELIDREIAAVRKVRDKARQELAQAQKELREVLTFEQEARFILMGYLD